MTIAGLVVAMSVLNFNFFLIAKPLLNATSLKGQAGVIAVVKYVHYFLVFYLELSQPASYFMWKNQPHQNIIDELQEMGLVRFYQD
jgi:hypothetical protein